MQHRPRLPRPGAACLCDTGSLHRLPATTGAHVLGGIPGGLCFPLGGGTPPMHGTSTAPPPWGLSVLLLSLFSPLRLLFLQSFHSRRTGRLALAVPAAASAGGGGGCLVSPSPSPLPLLRRPPGLSLLLLPRHPLPLAPRGWACCDGSDGVWPLCGPPPGVSRINQATMARFCSSGIPLPPSEGGAPLPYPVFGCPPAPLPSPLPRLA